MKWSDWLEKWGMASLKINVGILSTEWKPEDADKDAAWELYIELLTRVATQPLARNEGREAEALASVHQLFPLTRTIIRTHGRKCSEFTRIAIVVLNQVVRPFTGKWHRLVEEKAFGSDGRREEFRSDLDELQATLGKYSRMLADMAGVEDLTHLESAE